MPLTDLPAEERAIHPLAEAVEAFSAGRESAWGQEAERLLRGLEGVDIVKSPG